MKEEYCIKTWDSEKKAFLICAIWDPNIKKLVWWNEKNKKWEPNSEHFRNC